MSNWCICWFLTYTFIGILIFKGLTVQRLYKSFGVRGLITVVFLPFIKSQFTTNAPNVLYLNRYTSNDGLSHPFKRPGAVVDGLAELKYAFC
jgi:hypothetical protein